MPLPFHHGRANQTTKLPSCETDPVVGFMAPPKHGACPASPPNTLMLKGFMALPRYGRVEEIAGMVAYLAGPEVGYVTGASLTIGGGFNA